MITNPQSDFFAITNAFFAFSSFFFGLLVYLKSNNKRLGFIWFLFTISATVWGIGGVLIGIESEPDKALQVWRWSYLLGVNWISPLFFHFVLVFLKKENRCTLLIHYAITLFFCSISLTDYFFKGVRIAFNDFYCVIPNVGAVALVIWWHALVIWSHVLLWKGMKIADPSDKNKIKYFFFATAVGFGGGATEFLPMFKVDFYPWGTVLAATYPFIMGYAILRYQLMEISLFFKRAALFLSLYIVLLTASIPIFSWMYQRILANPPESLSTLVMGVLSVSLIISCGPLIYVYLLRNSYWLRTRTTTGLTHELKSPLGAIQGAAGIVMAELENSQNDRTKAVEYINMIQNNAARMETYVRDLLSLAGIQEDAIELNKSEANINELIRETLELVRPSAESKNISLIYKNSPEIYAMIDSDKLCQVISNILSNAIKFSHQGDIFIVLEKEAGSFRISISDSGLGIEKANLSKIFNRFYQVSPNSKGSGIGLAIAKAWVEAHGGKIWAESAGLGKGATVTFTLPV